MAKGYPDYYRGMVLYGLYNDIPKEITVDGSGNLAAFLKAMYGTIPTPITCDSAGNINIAVAVQNTDFKVVPASPEQNIPVKAGTGSADFPIDIKTQTLARLNTRTSLGTYYTSSNTINPSSGTTWDILELVGNIYINHLSFACSPGRATSNDSIHISIDGNEWAAIGFSEFRDFQTNGISGLPMLCTVFDDIGYLFKFALAEPIFCNSAIKIVWNGNAMNNGALQSKFGYYKI
jgi:hypothetical protein